MKQVFTTKLIWIIILAQKDVIEMNGQELLAYLAEQNNGILRTADAVRAGVSKPTLRKFVEKHGYERFMRGVYCAPYAWVDKMYLFQMRWPAAIFSHDTALFLHDMTDRDPLQYTVTMKTGRNPTNLTNAGLCVYTVKSELFSLGQMTMKTPYDNEVQTYNVERTVCDIVRSRNSMDGFIFQETLKRYARRKDKDLHRLMQYAKAFHVDSLMKQYMEVLL